MTDIVVPQTQQSAGAIVTDGNKGWGYHHDRGLEGKDATFLYANTMGIQNTLLNRDVVDNKSFFERGLARSVEESLRNHANTVAMIKDQTIETLKVNARQSEQLIELRTMIADGNSKTASSLAAMEARQTAVALQDAKNRILSLEARLPSPV